MLTAFIILAVAFTGLLIWHFFVLVDRARWKRTAITQGRNATMHRENAGIEAAINRDLLRRKYPRYEGPQE